MRGRVSKGSVIGLELVRVVLRPMVRPSPNPNPSSDGKAEALFTALAAANGGVVDKGTIAKMDGAHPEVRARVRVMVMVMIMVMVMS